MDVAAVQALGTQKERKQRGLAEETVTEAAALGTHRDTQPGVPAPSAGLERHHRPQSPGSPGRRGRPAGFASAQPFRNTDTACPAEQSGFVN